MYVADLKARLGFRIDDRKLRQFENMLRNTQKKLEASGKRLQNSINGVTREQVNGLNRVDTKLQHQKKQLDEINRKYIEQKALADRAHAAASRRALKGGSGASAAAGGAAGRGDLGRLADLGHGGGRAAGDRQRRLHRVARAPAQAAGTGLTVAPACQVGSSA